MPAHVGHHLRDRELVAGGLRGTEVGRVGSQREPGAGDLLGQLARVAITLGGVVVGDVSGARRRDGDDGEGDGRGRRYGEEDSTHAATVRPRRDRLHR